jgi:hypothetical protein
VSSPGILPAVLYFGNGAGETPALRKHAATPRKLLPANRLC